MIKDIISELNSVATSVAVSVKDLDSKRGAVKGTEIDLEAAKSDKKEKLA
ncbi:MAG: hypothetical protein JO347_11310, partial [Candidatus Eremiobacteraeota bacterium]|nr:hypothetical protein [Candidatus Eremiobacteraeota bacterium]